LALACRVARGRENQGDRCAEAERAFERHAQSKETQDLTIFQLGLLSVDLKTVQHAAAFGKTE
jgi:hypothetical protein